MTRNRSFLAMGTLGFLLIGLSACNTMKPGLYQKLTDDQVQAQSNCQGLFNNAGLNPLRGNMPLQASDIPTRQMLLANETPNEEQVAALQTLEGILQTCKAMMANVGYKTTATQDIFEARASKLRYGLYQGQIPFSVYNYGVVQALKEKNEFRMEGRTAYGKGVELGEQKAEAWRAEMHRQQQAYQMNQMQMQMNQQSMSVQSQLDRYTSSSNYTKTWNCTGTVSALSSSFASYRYSCR